MTKTMSASTPPDRCRLVLIASLGAAADALAEKIEAALAGGDVASLILSAGGADEAAFQAFCERVAPMAQERGAAVMIGGDSRIAGRVKADGVHLEVGKRELAEAVEALSGRMMVGAGGPKTRDDALELGEVGPDYLFFGRIGYDNRPEPHHRNLGLGRWWAEMIEIPCIVLAGSDIASVTAVAETGAEFVALSAAVFGEGLDPREAVARANALLDEAAPDLSERLGTDA